MVLSELPVGNVGSAPPMAGSELGGLAPQRRGSAAPTPMQSLCAAVKRLHRPGRPSRPRGRCLVGGETGASGWNRRQLLPDGGRMSADSGSHAGASTAALSLRDVRVSRLQWRSQNIFTGVARMRPLLTQGWPRNRSLGFKLLWIYLCLLARNVFISTVNQVQPCLNQLFMKETLNDCHFDLWNLREVIFILQIESFYKYLLPRLIPYYTTQTCSSNSQKSFSPVAVLTQT